MTADRSRTFDTGSAFSATLALKVLPRFTAVELLCAVNEILNTSGYVAELEPELTRFDDEALEARFWNRQKLPPRVGLKVNGVSVSVEGHDRPRFSPAGLLQLDDRDWTDGRRKIAKARAHLEIAEIRAMGGSDLDHNFDRAAAVTVVTQAATKLTEAVGVVWHASRRAIPVEELAPLVSAMSAGRAPVSLWLGCSPLSPAAEDGVATRGLYSLLGAEIEVVSTELSDEVAFDLALALATDILGDGTLPAQGARLGYGRDRDFEVDHRLPKQSGDVPAVVLSHVLQEDEQRIVAGAA